MTGSNGDGQHNGTLKGKSATRERILGKVRAGLGHEAGSEAERREAARGYIAAHARHLVPARATKPATELMLQFKAFLDAQGTAVIDVGGPADVPNAIVRFLADNGLPPRIRAGVDPWLTALPWSRAPSLELTKGPASPTDTAGLSHAQAGVAETGTLLLASGADNPVTLAFLPETHIVIVAEDDIVGGLEDGFDLIRARFGERHLPRTLNLVSGASRTADIGGRIVIGAHGPRRLAVVIVRNARGT